MMRLLEGEVSVGASGEEDFYRSPASTDLEMSRLKEIIAGQQRDLLEAQQEIRRVTLRNDQALGALRTRLLPLYRALQAVFGELDTVAPPDDVTVVAPDRRMAEVWASWKSRLGPGPSKVIDALLLHGEMNTQQLSIATGYHRTSIPAHIFKLNKAGLLNKNGGRFALKALP